jgi:hypothetical protein
LAQQQRNKLHSKVPQPRVPRSIKSLRVPKCDNCHGGRKRDALAAAAAFIIADVVTVDDI